MPRPASILRYLQLRLIFEQCLLQREEGFFLAGITTVDVGERGIGQGQTVYGIKRVQGRPPLSGQTLIGLDDISLDVEDRIELALRREESPHERGRPSGLTVHRAQEAPGLHLQPRVLQVRLGLYLGVARKGSQIAQVSGSAQAASRG